MDFPVCPSCHQSVIDDDPVECPFCGASMKGKPAAKTATKTATSVQGKPPASGTTTSVQRQPTPTAGTNIGKNGSKGPLGKPPTTGGKPPSGGSDDFPFDFEVPGKPAIQALPNPTKQRAFKVICPMCDTPGYLPATAAGQDVKCANSKCVMPVFTAPAPKKEPVVQAPPRKASKLPMIFGLLLLACAIGGGAVYWLYFAPPSKPKFSDADREAMLDGFNKPKVNNPNAQKVPDKAGEAEDGDKANGHVVDAEALIPEILKQMQKACEGHGPRAMKPYCRQLAAEANAICGNSAEVHKHLSQLRNVVKGFDYYNMSPLLELFWTDLNDGNDAKANVSLKAALAEVGHVPPQGRIRYEIIGRLAPALVAAGRSDDAMKNLAIIHSTEPDAQFAARMQIVTDGAIGIPTNSYSILPWRFPQTVATTATLINRGRTEAAQNWAISQADNDAKAECLAFWAEDFAYRKADAGSVDVDEKIATATEALPSVLQARVWARAGRGRLTANDMEGVSAAIKLAKTKLALVDGPPPPVAMPEDNVLNRFKVPNAHPLYQAATAVAEIAFLQAQTEATLPDAEKSLDLALAYVDATAPSLASAEERWEATVGLPLKEFREFIAKTSKLKNENRIKQIMGEYNDAMIVIKKAAEQRFEIEGLLLNRLRGAGVGLNLKVWSIVSSRAAEEDIDKRDDFLTRDLASELVEGLKGKNEAQAVSGAWALKDDGSAPPRPLAIEFKERLKKDPVDAVKYVESQGPRTSERDEFFLQQAAQLATSKRLSTAFKFIAALHDAPEELEQEDCYQMASAIASQPKRGLAEEVWKQVQNVTEQTDKIAICRGLIAGIKTPER